MNILVTGGSGFIGTRLVAELLQSDHQVAIFDILPSSKFPQLCLRGDVRDKHSLTAAATGRDAIIHLAAEHRDDPESTALAHEVNVGGAENVVAAARQAGCRRIIFTSSVAVYPLNTREVTEDCAPRPYNRYGESKLEAEQVFRQWAENTAGASLAIVRACVVFGEGNRGNVYNLLRQIQRRRFVMIGSGQNRKSMAYVGNLTRFLAACLEFPPGIHLYNYADKPDLMTAELVALVRRELGKPSAPPSSREREFADSSDRGCPSRSNASSPLPPGPAGPFRLPASSFQRPPSFRLPLWLGLAGGFVFDALGKLTGRQCAISSARIRKFCAETTVSTARLERTGFVRPFSMQEALVKTIQFEFGTPAPSK